MSCGSFEFNCVIFSLEDNGGFAEIQKLAPRTKRRRPLSPAQRKVKFAKRQHNDGNTLTSNRVASKSQTKNTNWETDRPATEELYLNMLTSQHRRRDLCHKTAFLKNRPALIEWMREVGVEFGFQLLTVPLAIRYLDRVNSVADISNADLQLVSLVCLLLAAKFEESDNDVPLFEELAELTDFRLDENLIKEAEVYVLNQLQWNLCDITFIHFLQYFLSSGDTVTRQDNLGGRRSIDDVASRFTKSFSNITAIVTKDYAFESYLPSVVASSIIAVARHLHGIATVWPKRLEKMTSHKFSDIHPCYAKMCSIYNDKYTSNTTLENSPTHVTAIF